jgi:hypothetical protein
MSSTDERRRGRLPFFFLKVADLGFLLREDEDLLDLTGVVSFGRLHRRMLQGSYA